MTIFAQPENELYAAIDKRDAEARITEDLMADFQVPFSKAQILAHLIYSHGVPQTGIGFRDALALSDVVLIDLHEQMPHVTHGYRKWG